MEPPPPIPPRSPARLFREETSSPQVDQALSHLIETPGNVHLAWPPPHMHTPKGLREAWMKATPDTTPNYRTFTVHLDDPEDVPAEARARILGSPSRRRLKRRSVSVPDLFEEAAARGAFAAEGMNIGRPKSAMRIVDIVDEGDEYENPENRAFAESPTARQLSQLTIELQSTLDDLTTQSSSKAVNEAHQNAIATSEGRGVIESPTRCLVRRAIVKSPLPSPKKAGKPATPQRTLNHKRSIRMVPPSPATPASAPRPVRRPFGDNKDKQDKRVPAASRTRPQSPPNLNLQPASPSRLPKPTVINQPALKPPSTPRLTRSKSAHTLREANKPPIKAEIKPAAPIRASFMAPTASTRSRAVLENKSAIPKKPEPRLTRSRSIIRPGDQRIPGVASTWSRPRATTDAKPAVPKASKPKLSRTRSIRNIAETVKPLIPSLTRAPKPIKPVEPIANNRIPRSKSTANLRNPVPAAEPIKPTPSRTASKRPPFSAAIAPARVPANIPVTPGKRKITPLGRTFVAIPTRSSVFDRLTLPTASSKARATSPAKRSTSNKSMISAPAFKKDSSVPEDYPRTQKEIWETRGYAAYNAARIVGRFAVMEVQREDVKAITTLLDVIFEEMRGAKDAGIIEVGLSQVQERLEKLAWVVEGGDEEGDWKELMARVEG
ncbi:hypothetical protein FPQ18DRAFT_337017 [Pyronema domesticum]|uniref:Uncharacterized protein n=1 Tax=Pyronema omphalodes (strain CBS 100304) TaxID=1076935 RepID=U4KVF8_PYROM|nr:hypothetical protein FPQ18DRAFT_337017 [Pyronema domesticum]CCX05262.1 Protein of unknown function [Pyronema omphalodes CBS 100304]